MHPVEPCLRRSPVRESANERIPPKAPKPPPHPLLPFLLAVIGLGKTAGQLAWAGHRGTGEWGQSPPRSLVTQYVRRPSTWTSLPRITLVAAAPGGVPGLTPPEGDLRHVNSAGGRHFGSLYLKLNSNVTVSSFFVGKQLVGSIFGVTPVKVIVKSSLETGPETA